MCEKFLNILYNTNTILKIQDKYEWYSDNTQICSTPCFDGHLAHPISINPQSHIVIAFTGRFGLHIDSISQPYNGMRQGNYTINPTKSYNMRLSIVFCIVLVFIASVQTASIRDEGEKVIEKRSPLLLGKVALLKGLHLLKKLPLPPLIIPTRFEFQQVHEPIVRSGYHQ